MADIITIPSIAELQSLVRLWESNPEKFHEAFMLRRIIQDCYGLTAEEAWAIQPQELYDLSMRLIDESLSSVNQKRMIAEG